jgi:hypothetical protein
MMPRLALLFLLAGCPKSGPTAPASAQQALPTADTILDAWVATMGGEEMLRSTQSSLAIGTVEMAAAGMTMQMKIYSAAPNWMLVDMEVAGLGSFQEGVSDGVAWAKDPMTGARIKDGPSAKQALRNATLLSPLMNQEFYPTRETLEALTFEGQPAYKVRMVDTEGIEEFRYFHQENGLQLGSDAIAHTTSGELPTRSVNKEHLNVDGAQIPSHIVTTMGPMTMVTRLTEVVVNGPTEDWPDQALPPEIQGLLDEETD